MTRDPMTRDQDRADLLALLGEADEPITLHAMARDTWDGTSSWERHVHRVYGDLAALRRADRAVSDGATYAGNQAQRWAPADSPLADALSDVREVQRMTAGWEKAPLPEVPC